MKNLKLLLLAIPFVLFSCSDDDNYPDPKLLVGEWEIEFDAIISTTINNKVVKRVLDHFYFPPTSKPYSFLTVYDNETLKMHWDKKEGEKFEYEGSYKIKREKIIINNGEFIFFFPEENFLGLTKDNTDEVKKDLPNMLKYILSNYKGLLIDEEINILEHIINNPDEAEISKVTETRFFKRVK